MLPSQRLDKARKCRIGLDGYCRLLAYMQRVSRTNADIAQYMKIDIQTARFLTRWMLRLKMIHRPEWVRPTQHSRMVPKFRLGPDGDTPCPDREDSGPQRKMASGLVLLGTTIELLRAEPMTISELADELKMHVETGSRLIGLLRKHGLCHVKSWIKPAIGVTVAQHVFGPGNDAQRPPTACPKVLAKQHRETFNAKRRHLKMVHALAGAANQDVAQRAA